jgi:oxygen-independent coproporphyrinogen III oxidase
LKRLGRIHSSGRAIEAVRAAQAVGFDSVSFDLMCWLPGQSMASWMRTVEQAVALDPQHLSMYLLELYPNAPLKEDMARAGWSQAPDDDAADMYLAALERFDTAGLEQYEISNVARPGFLSRHNVKYWQGGDWHGFGCGAHSTVDGVRWKNLASTTEYVERMAAGDPRSVRVDERRLAASERIEEALFTGMRLTAGIDGRAFVLRYGLDPWERYGAALTPFVGDRLMWHKEDRFGLTRHGMLLANEILASFV